MRFGIAGSAHLDILAKVTGDTLAIDKVGTVSIEIGGTGANLAINLSKMNHQAKMLTAMSSSPYSKIVLEYLKNMGVQPVVEWQESLPLAAFCAQLDQDGELETAISSMPVAEIAFSETSINHVTSDVDALLLECNLSVAQINRLLKKAKHLGTQTFLSAVSEEKAVKIGDIDKDNRPSAIFLNRREYKSLTKSIGMSGSPVPYVSEYLGSDLIVTNANSTIEIGYANGDADTLNSAGLKEFENTLGAGDSLMSGAIHYRMTQGSSWPEAIDLAMEMVKRVLNKRNCNLGEQSAIESALNGLHTSAEKDGLTGLYNRATGSRLAEIAFAEARKCGCDLSVIILDIDNFKSINDTYGHDSGDVVIKSTANEINQAVRENDIAARWGGEEFVCILPGAKKSTAKKVAERIRGSIESTIKTPKQVTVSLGVASLNMNTKTVDALIKEADQALYEAKTGGRNRVVCR